MDTPRNAGCHVSSTAYLLLFPQTQRDGHGAENASVVDAAMELLGARTHGGQNHIIGGGNAGRRRHRQIAKPVGSTRDSAVRLVDDGGRTLARQVRRHVFAVEMAFARFAVAGEARKHNGEAARDVDARRIAFGIGLS